MPVVVVVVVVVEAAVNILRPVENTMIVIVVVVVHALDCMVVCAEVQVARVCSALTSVVLVSVLVVVLLPVLVLDVLVVVDDCLILTSLQIVLKSTKYAKVYWVYEALQFLVVVCLPVFSKTSDYNEFH